MLKIMPDPDDILNSDNKFIRFCMFLYRIFDVPVTAFKGNERCLPEWLCRVLIYCSVVVSVTTSRSRDRDVSSSRLGLVSAGEANVSVGTLEDERTVLYKTKSLDGTKLNTNHKTNPNPNTNPIQLFYVFYRAPSPDLQSSPTSPTGNHMLYME